MEFGTLRINDLVKWNDITRYNFIHFEDAQAWEYEPYDCVLQVVDIHKVGGESTVELDCVNSCGQHSILTVSQTEYINYSYAVPGGLLQGALMEEAMEQCGSESEEEDFITEQKKFFEQLLDSLARKAKRGRLRHTQG